MKFKDVKLVSPNMHLIFGMHRTGKTAVGFDLLDRLHKETGKEVYIGLGEKTRRIEDVKGIPKYIHSWRDLLPPTDSIFYTCDAHRQFHARKAMTNENTILDTYHGTFAHDDVDYLYDTQLNSSIDRNFIMRAWYRWYKMPYALELEMGRSAIGQEVEDAQRLLQGKDKTWVYLRGEESAGIYTGLVSDVPLPSYWCDDISKMHRRGMSVKDVVKSKRWRIW